MTAPSAGEAATAGRPEPEGDSRRPGRQRPAAKPQRQWADSLSRWAAVYALVLLAIGFSLALPETFPRWATVQTLLTTQAVAGIVALAVLFPLAAGQLDLSIGAIAGFTALVVAKLSGEHGWDAGTCIAAGLLIGPALGCANGVIVGVFRIDSIIATLATGTIMTGAAIAVSNAVVTIDLESNLAAWAQGKLFGEIPVPALYLAAVALVVWFLLDVTAWGRYLRVAGANSRSAALIGLPVFRLRFSAFVAAGLFAGVAGILSTMSLGSASQSAGAALLLPAYAAAFVGSTTILPGRFNVPGTLVAVFLLAVGITGIQLMGGAAWVQLAFTGTALIIAVAVPAWRQRDLPA